MNTLVTSSYVISFLVKENREALSTSKIHSYPLGSLTVMLLMEHVGIVRPIVSFVAFPKQKA